MSDEKIVSLTERRKRDMPVYDGTIADTAALLKALLESLEANGQDQLLAGTERWSVIITKTRLPE
jgi:hypothetical protein